MSGASTNAPGRADWEEVARVFGLVMDATVEERVAILDRECADDGALRAEVEALLAADVATAGDVAALVAEAVEEIVTRGGADESDQRDAIVEAGLEPGALVDDRYAITRLLGSGGMGVVVAAEHRGLNEPVALKLLKPGALATERVRRRFLREAKAAARMKSPHVVKVRDVGTLPTGAPYMVMDLLEGADLAAVIRARGPLPTAEACRITLQACEALATAHARGVIHRDIKPGNLFLERAAHGDLTLKLLDFGISKLVGADPDGEGVLTRTSDMVGSPAYMSPEQLRSSRDVDARSDLWSLGVVLYEMLAGARPFRADNVADLSMMVLAEPPPSLGDAVPPALRGIVERCLAKDRDARYADVGELATALAPFCGAEGHRGARRVLATLGAPPVVDEADGDEDWALAETIASGEQDEPLADGRNQEVASEGASSSRATWALAAAVLVGAGVIGLSLSATSEDPAAEFAPPPSATSETTPSLTTPGVTAAPASPSDAPSATATASASAPAVRPPGPGPMPRPGMVAAQPTGAPTVDPYATRK